MQAENLNPKEQDSTADKEAISSPVITLRSELAQEIISRRAGFVENWTLPIFLLLLLTIFGGSWFVHYPDSITTRTIIIAENGPSPITVATGGILIKLLRKDGDIVKRNDTIAWLESKANHQPILSPTNGTLSISSLIHKGQHLKPGSLIGYTVPQIDSFYAEAFIPQNNLGKIDTGLNVQLKLDAYPYQEWGMIHGKVCDVSKVLSKSGVLVTIKLTSDLLNSDNKKVVLRDGLNAEATIITKDVRLFQKFYYSFISSTSLDK